MKDFVLGICAVSVLVAALKILIPPGNTEKSLKYAIGIFITVSIISGVKSVKLELPQVKAVETVLFTEDMKTAMLKTSLNSVLGEYGIETKEIYFDTDILEDGGIKISKVTVILQKKEDAKKAMEIIKSQTGLLAEVK